MPNIGDRVQILRGLPSRYGQPLGAIRGTGPVNLRVQLYADGSDRYVPHGDVEVLPEGEPTVIVGCGGEKLKHPAPAGEMYTSTYHRLARDAARSLTTPGRTFILSALHGLLRLEDVIEPYDLRIGQDGAVTALKLANQVKEMGETVQARVIILAGKDYADLAKAVWPYAETPLAGKGIGDQQAILKGMAA